MTTITAVTATLSLVTLFLIFGGVWAQPPAENSSLLGWTAASFVIIDAAPPEMRASLAAAATNAVSPDDRIDWYPVGTAISSRLDEISLSGKVPQAHPDLFDGRPRSTVVFVPHSIVAPPSGLRFDPSRYPHPYLIAAQLQDKSWLVFTSLVRTWGLTLEDRWGIGLILLLLSALIVSALAARQLARPIALLSNAVHRFGLDPQAAPIAETGPRELRQVTATFNAMQAQIRRLVTHRTTMLAAISHDLRTPLTRIRLRGEYIDDDEQRRKLFRDVDEMQAMVDGALAFFRGDSADEHKQSFDFAGLLQTIANDYADQGIDVAFEGPSHTIFFGRPFALKRAISNIIDNAIKYGAQPMVELRRQDGLVEVFVRDSGPGIAPEEFEHVFNPYYRLEASRNRATGGVGLGLTAARSIIQVNGGDIILRNRHEGGLEVRVVLPSMRSA